MPQRTQRIQSAMQVLLFGAAAERAGAAALHVPPCESVASLRRRLIEVCPDLAAIAGSLLVAVNHRYARDDEPIAATDEVAVFPPVSGG